MKKSKLLIPLLLAAFSLSACNFSKPSKSNEVSSAIVSSEQSKESSASSSSAPSNQKSEENNPKIYEIYQLYLADGGTLTYQEWLETIKGEDGKDGLNGITPHIGENGNWYIDDVDTGVRAQGRQGAPGSQGPQGEPGENGKSAYELYKEAHPEYNKSEEEWLDDLINGRLANKEIHTVTFDSNGGGNIASQTVQHGEKIQKPEDPSRQGYTFDGWYYQDEKWSFVGYVVTEDMTLIGHWTENTYSVTFKNDDGTIIDYQDAVLYSHIVPPANPTKDDTDEITYSFVEWIITIGENEVTYVASYEACTKALVFQDGVVKSYNGTTDKTIYVPSSFNGIVITTIGNNCFRHKTNIETIVLPDSITTFSDYCFDCCSSLKNINFPAALTTIGNCSFRACTLLTEINIPAKVSQIDNFAFDECSAIENYIVDGANQYFSSIDGVLFDKRATMLYHFPAARGGEYVVPNSVISLVTLCFYGSNLETIYLGDRVGRIDALFVSTIGTNAFAGCNSLKAVNVSSGNSKFASYDGVLYNKSLTELIYVPVAKEGRLIIPETLDKLSASLIENDKIELEIKDGIYYLGTENNPYKFLIKVADKEAESYTINSQCQVIYNSAFSMCKNMTSIVIPNSVTRIDNSAFYYCSALASIQFGNGLTSIGNNVFDGCSSLISAVIPEGVTSMGGGDFQNCSSLQSVTFPSSIISIGDFFFNNCSSLQTVNIPKNLDFKSLDIFTGCVCLTTVNIDSENTHFAIKDNILFRENSILYACLDRQITTYEVAQSVTEIAGSAFADCTHLTNITLSENIKTIYYSAFSDCVSLVSIAIPSQVKYLFDGVFYGCTSLRNVELPNGLIKISGQAFENCRSLYSIDLPDTVTTIMARAFINSGLTIVNLPRDLRSLHVISFDGCVWLHEIVDNWHLISDEVITVGDVMASGLLTLNNEKESLVITSDKTQIKTVIGDDYITLENKLIRYIGNSSSVTIPNGIEIISNSSFRDCVDVISVTLNESISEIKTNAFKECSSLKTINFPSSLQAVYPSAFDHCISLTSAVFQEGLLTLDDGAFQNCTSLTSVSLPASMTYLGLTPFLGCTNINEVNIAEGNTKYVFLNGIIYDAEQTRVCEGFNKLLTGHIVLPDTVTVINNYAFALCSQMTSIALPYSLTKMGTYAFAFCSSLEYIVMDINPALYIFQYAFIGCDSLSTVYRVNRNTMQVENEGNELLFAATFSYYSEEEPVEEGNYWRYVDGVPTVW